MHGLGLDEALQIRNRAISVEDDVDDIDTDGQSRYIISVDDAGYADDALAGWRRVSVRERRTAVDWAEEMRVLLQEDYPDAEKIILVCDNLNTHKIASFYKAFEARVARGLVERMEIPYTPKHGSRLNIAECELGILTRQCLGRRVGDIKTLRRECRAWQKQRNAAQKGVDWRFTAEDARIRLKHLYPNILV